MYRSTASMQRIKRWAPKTRTGCMTCRKRRIKCDEVRPVCRACHRLNHICTYNSADFQNHREGIGTSRNQVIVVSRDVNLRPTTSEEAFHLDIYCKVIAPWLSTYAQPEFFELFLPLRGSQHQAIRHALVAVAMAGEECYLKRHVKRHRRMWHYDQALRHMYAPKAPKDAIMFACVALWLHDNMIENTRSAVLHCKGFVRMLLAFEQARTPAGFGKNLDCTIWRGLSHWGQRTQPNLDTRLGLDAIATIRQKLKDPRLGMLRQDTGSGTADALLFVTSCVWACDEHSGSENQASPITLEELRSFLDIWYETAATQVGSNIDNHAVLKCHYTVMLLAIRAQERSNLGESPSLIDDTEAFLIFEAMLTSLESISAESCIQQPGKRDLILPIIPVALEAERMAATSQQRLRIGKFLQSTRRVESFWGTSVVADVIHESFPT